MIMNLFSRSRTLHIALACGVSAAALGIAAPAVAQDSATSFQVLRQATEIADGTQVTSISSDMLVARRRDGDRSFLVYDSQNGAMTVERGGKVIVSPLLSPRGVEKSFSYDYASQTLSGDAESARVFNTFFRPAAMAAPEQGADTTWQVATSLEALGVARANAELLLNLSRSYLQVDGKQVVLLEFDIPAFQYVAPNGDIVVHWARGFALADTSFSEIHVLGTQHRASVIEENGNLRPVSVRTSMHGIDQAGAWTLPLNDAPRVRETVARVREVSGDTVHLIADQSGAAPADNFSVRLARYLDRFALAAVEGGANPLPIGYEAGTSDSTLQEQLGEVSNGDTAPPLIDPEGSLPMTTRSWSGATSDMRVQVLMDPNAPVIPYVPETETERTAREAREAQWRERNRAMLESFLPPPGMEDWVLEPPPTGPMDPTGIQLSTRRPSALADEARVQLLRDYPIVPHVPETEAERAAREARNAEWREKNNAWLEELLPPPSLSDWLSDPANNPPPEIDPNIIKNLIDTGPVGGWNDNPWVLPQPTVDSSDLLPDWIDKASLDAATYVDLINYLQSQLEKLREQQDLDAEAGSGLSSLDEFVENNAFEYLSMVGIIPTDLSRWAEWLVTQNVRELERLALLAGYPNLASALADAQNIINQSQDPGYRQWAQQAPSCSGPAGCGPSYLERWWMKTSLVALGDILADSRGIFSSGGFSDIGIAGLNLSYLLRDHALEDGDIVQIRITQFGKLIYEGELSLTNAGNLFNLALGRGVASLEIFAVNEGSARPNTAQIRVDNVVRGEDTQTYSLATGETATLRIEAGATAGAAGNSGVGQ
ncbi:MAG: hypothetical protein Q8R02_08685 [Hyphomonadaceae bacterium]|nr:hypothetical protein [Hyphomonadaceae bacterium]